MFSTKRIVETLGGQKALKTRVLTLEDLRAKLQRGLPYESFRALSSAYSIDAKDMSTILAVPERTLARRKKEKWFRANESDRLFRLGRVLALAEDVLGSKEKARSWLHRSNRALGKEIPLRHLDSDLGARRVEDVLLRIAHGVHS